MSIVYNGIYYLMYGFLILIAINMLFSWFPGIYRFKFAKVLWMISDTYMHPFHGVLVLGILDFTPLLGVITFELLIQAYIYLVNSAWL